MPDSNCGRGQEVVDVVETVTFGNPLNPRKEKQDTALNIKLERRQNSRFTSLSGRDIHSPNR
jgi:hypothetical protein